MSKANDRRKANAMSTIDDLRMVNGLQTSAACGPQRVDRR